jgi:hypothetical protein
VQGSLWLVSFARLPTPQATDFAGGKKLLPILLAAYNGGHLSLVVDRNRVFFFFGNC